MNRSITLPYNGRETPGLPFFPYSFTQHAKETA